MITDDLQFFSYQTCKIVRRYYCGSRIWYVFDVKICDARFVLQPFNVIKFLSQNGQIEGQQRIFFSWKYHKIVMHTCKLGLSAYPKYVHSQINVLFLWYYVRFWPMYMGSILAKNANSTEKYNFKLLIKGNESTIIPKLLLN